MKKTYIEPATIVLNVQIENVMQMTSQVNKGEDWTSGEAASRGAGAWDDED